MKIDTFLKIGHSHEMCQDYILSGDDPCPFIILADGCSSAKDSDLGARILCHAALEQLKTLQSYLASVGPVELGQWIINKALKSLNHFTTNIDCLDATLIIVYKFEGNYYIYMYGDGLLHIVNPDDETRTFRRYYKPNAPAYLRYRVNDYNKYKNAHVASFMEISGICDQVEDDVMAPFFHKVHEGDVKDLIIASDGAESFTYKDEVRYKTLYLNLLKSIKQSKPILNLGKPDEIDLDYELVLYDFSKFKLTSGAFLKRRVKKVMKNYLKQGFINDDDLAIGCFHEEWE